MINGATIEPSAALGAAVIAEWERLGRPGPAFTGPERVELCQVVRTARGPAPALDSPAEEAAIVLAARPESVTVGWIDDLERAGLTRSAYVEVLGITSRVVAIDTFVRGLGAGPLPLPSPRPGEATGRLDPEAKRRSAWVAMVGPATPPATLSWLPSEKAALEDLHGVLYLSMAEMFDLDRVGELTRAQMEFVAARTSWHNDCFF